VSSFSFFGRSKVSKFEDNKDVADDCIANQSGTIGTIQEKLSIGNTENDAQKQESKAKNEVKHAVERKETKPSKNGVEIVKLKAMNEDDAQKQESKDKNELKCIVETNEKKSSRDDTKKQKPKTKERKERKKRPSLSIRKSSKRDSNKGVVMESSKTKQKKNRKEEEKLPGDDVKKLESNSKSKQQKERKRRVSQSGPSTLAKAFETNIKKSILDEKSMDQKGIIETNAQEPSGGDVRKQESKSKNKHKNEPKRRASRSELSSSAKASKSKRKIDIIVEKSMDQKGITETNGQDSCGDDDKKQESKSKSEQQKETKRTPFESNSDKEPFEEITALKGMFETFEKSSSEDDKGNQGSKGKREEKRGPKKFFSRNSFAKTPEPKSKAVVNFSTVNEKGITETNGKELSKKRLDKRLSSSVLALSSFKRTPDFKSKTIVKLNTESKNVGNLAGENGDDNDELSTSISIKKNRKRDLERKIRAKSISLPTRKNGIVTLRTKSEDEIFSLGSSDSNNINLSEVSDSNNILQSEMVGTNKIIPAKDISRKHRIRSLLKSSPMNDFFSKSEQSNKSGSSTLHLDDEATRGGKSFATRVRSLTDQNNSDSNAKERSNSIFTKRRRLRDLESRLRGKLVN